MGVTPMSESLHLPPSQTQFADHDAAYSEIVDNSKRSVSIRINTSDYGRIKAIGRRLKVRESDVFRFLLKIGLRETTALSQTKPSFEQLLKMFASHAADLVSHFNLSGRRLEQLLQAGDEGSAPVIAEQDIELLAASILPERYLAMRLHELTGADVPPAAAQKFLQTYLEAKYLPTCPAAQAEH